MLDAFILFWETMLTSLLRSQDTIFGFSEWRMLVFVQSHVTDSIFSAVHPNSRWSVDLKNPCVIWIRVLDWNYSNPILDQVVMVSLECWDEYWHYRRATEKYALESDVLGRAYPLRSPHPSTHTKFLRLWK